MSQDNKIKIRRGLDSALPSPNTEIGELRYSTDAKKLYIDDGVSNVYIGGDVSSFPISTAVQTALDSKLNKDIIAGVERAYIINADGSQGTKATSDFKDVLEFADFDAFPATGETGKFYLDLDANKTYRWSGSVYVQIGGGGSKLITTNNSVSGTFNIDANLTDTYVLTLTGNTTLALINFSSTIAQQMTIYITGNFALTYPAGVKIYGNYSTTKTNQLVLERVGSKTYITINNYV